MDAFIKNKRVKSYFEEIEPQEVFWDNLAQKKEEYLGISEQKMEVPFNQNVFKFFYAIFILFISTLFLKTFSMQIIHGGEFFSLARNNIIKKYPLRAERGVIYDRNLNQLVFNIQSFDLLYDRDFFYKDEPKGKDLEEVSKIIKKDAKDLEKEIKDSKIEEVLIAQNLDQDTLVSLEANIKNFSGFRIEKNTIRNYTVIPNFSNIVGYTGKINQDELKISEDYSVNDYIGRTGLEKYYEKVLRGKSGIAQAEKDAFGNKKREEIVSQPRPGKNLVLYADAELQKKAEEALKKSIKNVGSKKGAVVAIDPRNGGILALISIPAFDNNFFSKKLSQKELNDIYNDPLNPLFNRAVSGIGYPSGSVIKPLIGVGALEEGTITPKTKINDLTGGISIPDRWDPAIRHYFYNFEKKSFGVTDIYKALANSVNVFFYAVGGGYGDIKGLGPTKIKQWLENFGWGKPTGIDLAEEGSGFLPDPDWKKETLGEIWFDGDTYHLSIGQGYLTVTPLQAASAFAAIANGGILYQPQIVKEIIDKPVDLKENLLSASQKIEPKILNQDFAAEKNFKVVREGMREAVLYGSAAGWLNSLPVAAAAKTGTAQTGKDGYNHSWVSVFAPYDDPKIVLTVLVEDVKEGQVAALPVAKEILEWYFKENKN